jgi:integrase
MDKYSSPRPRHDKTPLPGLSPASPAEHDNRENDAAGGDLSRMPRIQISEKTHAWTQDGVTVKVCASGSRGATRIQVYLGSGHQREFRPGRFRNLDEADESAKAWVRELLEARNNNYNVRFSSAEVEEIVGCRQALLPLGLSLGSGVRELVAIYGLMAEEGTPNKQQSFRALAAIRQLLNGRPLPVLSDVSFADIRAELVEYKAADEIEDGTLRDWEWVLDTLIAAFPGPIRLIKTEDLSRWIRNLACKRSRGKKKAGAAMAKSSRTSVRFKVRAIFHILQERGYLPVGETAADRLPAFRRSKSDKDRKRIEVYTLEEIKRLLAEIEEEFTIVVELVQLGGFRQCEAFRSTWEDIFRFRDYLDVPVEVAGKACDQRRIPLLPMLERRLERYRAAFEAGQLKGRVVKKYKTLAHFNTALNRAIRRVLGRIAPNGLRHGFGSFVIPQLGSPLLLAGFMGNSEQALFLSYLKVGITIEESNEFVSMGVGKLDFENLRARLIPILLGPLSQSCHKPQVGMKRMGAKRRAGKG